MFLERAIILLFLNLCLDEIINAMILILKKAFFSLIDIVLSPFSLLYLFLLRLVRRFGVPNFPLHRRLFRFIGVFPIIDHYYEPKFVYEKDIVHNEKRLIGIDFNEEVQIAELHSLKYVNELFNLEDKHAAYGFYFNNTAQVIRTGGCLGDLINCDFTLGTAIPSNRNRYRNCRARRRRGW